MRHRFFPFTAGDRHGWPDRVRAPQRGLASIGPVLRRWCCGSGAIFSPVSSSLELNRRSVLVAAAWQKPAFSSAGLANDCPVLRTPSRLSSRSSESNSVRHRRARLNRWQRAQSRLPCMGLFYQKLDYYSRYLIDFPRSGFKNLDCFLIDMNR
jgi:hypothetical protein